MLSPPEVPVARREVFLVRLVAFVDQRLLQLICPVRYYPTNLLASERCRNVVRMHLLHVRCDFLYHPFVTGSFEAFTAATDHRSHPLLLSLSH